MLHSASQTIHLGAYVQSSDPGAVGAKLLWIDTTSGYVLKKRNAGNAGWDTLATLTSVTLSDGDKGDITVSSSGATFTIDSGVVSLAKLADLAQDQFIGRTTASTGVPQTATITAAARTVLDDTTVGAMLTTLGGQPLDAELTAIAGLTSAADKGIQFSGSGSAATFDLTTAGKALLDDADASAQRTTLGLGTAALISSTAGGDLAGTLPNPTVAKIHETSGPTALTIGTITDGQFLKRVGTTLVSAAAGGTLADGDYGDVVVSGSGTVLSLDSGVVTTAAKTVLDDTTIAAMRATLGVAAMSVIFDSTLGADTATIDTGAAGIPAGYNILEIFIIGRTDEATISVDMALTFNNDTGTNYSREYVGATNATASIGNTTGDAAIKFPFPGTTVLANVPAVWRIAVPGYADTTFFKGVDLTGGIISTTAAHDSAYHMAAIWRSTAAITRVAISAITGGKKLVTGSRMIIYGR